MANWLLAIRFLDSFDTAANSNSTFSNPHQPKQKDLSQNDTLFVKVSNGDKTFKTHSKSKFICKNIVQWSAVVRVQLLVDDASHTVVVFSAINTSTFVWLFLMAMCHGPA